MEPPRLEAGDLPADLLARFGNRPITARKGPTKGPTPFLAVNGEEDGDEANHSEWQREVRGVSEGNRTPDLQDHNLAL